MESCAKSYMIEEYYEDLMKAVRRARRDGIKVQFYAQSPRQKGVPELVSDPEIHIVNPNPTTSVLKP